MLTGMIDWTQVLVLGVPAYLTAILSPIVVLIVAKNRRALKVPSGGTIGEKVELTHDLASVSVKTLHKINGDMPRV